MNSGTFGGAWMAHLASTALLKFNYYLVVEPARDPPFITMPLLQLAFTRFSQRLSEIRLHEPPNFPGVLD